jgi:hypothetical protein
VCETSEIVNAADCKDCINVVEAGKFCANCEEQGTGAAIYLSTNLKECMNDCPTF